MGSAVRCSPAPEVTAEVLRFEFARQDLESKRGFSGGSRFPARAKKGQSWLVH